MPELPEVTVFGAYAEREALHQAIVEVEVLDPRILEVEATALQHLKGQSFTGVKRIGKVLLMPTSAGQWLTVHFGMTGYWQAFNKGEQPPRFASVLFKFENGKVLAFVCSRKLGRVGLTDDLEKFKHHKQLGTDALEVDFETFYSLFKGRNGTLKGLLTNQSLLAGIGNVYADEILFQLGVHPKARVKGWGEADFRRLYDAMGEVLQQVIDCNAEEDKLPDGYLTPHRKPGERFEGCEGGVQQIKTGGRSTYLCPEKQQL